MRFCYWMPEMSDHTEALETKLEDRFWVNWMQSMVDSNPDTIFFFVTATTDIPDAEFGAIPKE
jgi:hypothetical protein